MAYRDSQILRELIACARLAASEMISQSGANETGSHFVIHRSSVIVATASRESVDGRHRHPRIERRPIGCCVRHALALAIAGAVLGAVNHRHRYGAEGEHTEGRSHDVGKIHAANARQNG